MGRIASAFKRLSKLNEAAFIPYVPIGYPSVDITRQLVPVIARQGADLIELGAAPSDLSTLSSGLGVTLEDCLSVAAEARLANEIPLILVCSYEAISAYGSGEFTSRCAVSGVDGLLVPNLPLAEYDNFRAGCESAGIDLIIVVTPATTDDELQRVGELASGFVYCAALTNEDDADPEEERVAQVLIERIRSFTDLPVVVGSSVNLPEQVASMSRIASGCVSGSALYHIIASQHDEEVMLEVAEYVRALKEATR